MDKFSLIGKNILIVDDESDIRELLHEKFKKEGCNVFEAANGGKALELIKSHKMDAIISDIKMPKSDGVELLKTLRAMNSSIKIFLMTGHPNATKEEIYALGAVALIHKPNDIPIVTNIVRQLIST